MALPTGNILIGTYIQEAGIQSLDPSVVALGTPPPNWSTTNGSTIGGNAYDILGLYQYEDISNNAFLVLATCRSDTSNAVTTDFTAGFLRVFSHPLLVHFPLSSQASVASYDYITENVAPGTFQTAHATPKTGVFKSWKLSKGTSVLFKFLPGAPASASSIVSSIDAPLV